MCSDRVITESEHKLCPSNVIPVIRLSVQRSLLQPASVTQSPQQHVKLDDGTLIPQLENNRNLATLPNLVSRCVKVLTWPEPRVSPSIHHACYPRHLFPLHTQTSLPHACIKQPSPTLRSRTLDLVNQHLTLPISISTRKRIKQNNVERGGGRAGERRERGAHKQ